METTFKFLFGFAVFLFSLISIGVFLLILKIILMFTPQIQLLGLTIY
ncbi:MAG TPA: hypothetical protein PLA05_00545 [bacterium]|nr:MAG: hypothetical protein BWX82_00010 [Parcubacteria group bacterium ADurb.Bin115]HNU81430.1 hypothetical protein [bacterium]HOD86789.1 hypothetical protein [bacterium]HPW05442.1 hypothetical protein [bacterium]HQB76223.1 hypothetical protein [bacterium]